MPVYRPANSKTAVFITTALLLSVMPLSPLFAADKSLAILGVASFANEGDIPFAVRKECDLETYIPKFVHRYARKAYPDSRLANAGNTGSDHVLNMTIIKVHAEPGGKYSGAKWVQIKGELKDEKGKLIGSFTGQRTTSGFKTGFSPGKTCKFLQRVGRALGKDIGVWLRNPSINSYIGEMADRNKQTDEGDGTEGKHRNKTRTQSSI